MHKEAAMRRPLNFRPVGIALGMIGTQVLSAQQTPLKVALLLQTDVVGMADTYTLCNALCDWDDDLGSRILQSIRLALPPKGRILVIDRVFPSPDDPSHTLIAFLDLWFLVMEGGRIRTRSEYERLLARAGFGIVRVVPTASEFSVIEAVPTVG